MGILVVDDADVVRAVLIDILEDAGYTVVGAIDGFAALDCLRHNPRHFRLVLLDVMMPLMNGWEVLRALQRDPVLAAIPVVMMTAGWDVRHEAYARGAAGYLPKPIAIDTLLTVVDHFYSHSLQRSV
jgi:CheY-like chemotaxis protein